MGTVVSVVCDCLCKALDILDSVRGASRPTQSVVVVGAPSSPPTSPLMSPLMPPNIFLTPPPLTPPHSLGQEMAALGGNHHIGNMLAVPDNPHIDSCALPVRVDSPRKYSVTSVTTVSYQLDAE